MTLITVGYFLLICQGHDCAAPNYTFQKFADCRATAAGRYAEDIYKNPRTATTEYRCIPIVEAKK